MEPTATDLDHLRRAIKLASDGVEQGHSPYAAVLVAKDGEKLFEGTNITVTTGDPLNHAEMNVLREAHRKHGIARIDGASLYVNGEPCTMCAGTILRYGIARLFFGMPEEKLRPYFGPTNGHSYSCAPIYAMAAGTMEVAGDILADEAKPTFERFKAKRG